MKTIRTTIEGFVYDHIDHFANLIYDGGCDTVIDGIHVLDDPLTLGALINITCELYVHYKALNDSRTAHAEEMIHTFIKFIAGHEVSTWGKIALARGLWVLKKAGCIGMITKDELAVCEEKTRYDDFFDKEKCELIGKAANYVQVAFAVACYREKVGFDTDNYSESILTKLEGLVSDGWMDDEPGSHRYDRYSMMLPSEAVDNFINAGKPVSDSIKNNLKASLELTLFMANKRGDGVNYGRSLSIHGDSGPCEIISSAFAIGVVDEKDKQLAIDYTLTALDKIFSFWYDSDRKSVNIWLDGRTTNEYRNIGRYIETNVDFAVHLLAMLHNFEHADVCDIEFADTIPSPTKWQYKHTVFEQTEDGIWSLITLRKDDKLVMLPLVGAGALFERCTYQPFPHLMNYLDACPNGEYPYLIPEYTDRYLDRYRPGEFYDSVEIGENDGKITIVAKGIMCRFNGLRPWKMKPQNRFTTTYVVDGDEVSVEFENNLGECDVQMYTGTFFEGQQIETFGFSSCYELPNISNPIYRSHHGAFKHVYVHENFGTTKISYKVRLY